MAMPFLGAPFGFNVWLSGRLIGLSRMPGMAAAEALAAAPAVDIPEDLDLVLDFVGKLCKTGRRDSP